MNDQLIFILHLNKTSWIELRTVNPISWPVTPSKHNTTVSFQVSIFCILTINLMYSHYNYYVYEILLLQNLNIFLKYDYHYYVCFIITTIYVPPFHWVYVNCFFSSINNSWYYHYHISTLLLLCVHSITIYKLNIFLNCSICFHIFSI